MKTRTRALQRAAAILLCLAMAASSLILLPAAQDTDATPISTEAELMEMEQDGSYILTADILLTEEWTPIPTFSGTLDGNGYAIRGLQITDAASTNWSNSGLIASLEGGTIRNLTLYGSITNNVSGYSVQIGAFAGQVKNGSLENCVSYVSITTGDDSGHVYVGGLVGVVSKSCKLTMTNCANYGAIDASCATSKYTNVGGLVGAVSGSADFVNASNYGDIYAVSPSNGHGQAGGMVGSTETVANNCVITFRNSRNAGAVVSNGYTGGFVGVGKGTITVENCVNYGTVTDESAYAAGFLALTEGPATMTGCVNLGNVTVTGRYLSGIIASATSGAVCEVRYCANLGNLTGTYNNTNGEFYGGIIGRNQASGGVFANGLSLGGMTANVASDDYVGGIGGSEGSNAFENCFTSYEKLLGYGEYATSTEGSAVITAESDLEEIVGILNSGTQTPMFRLNNGAIEPIYEMNRVPTQVIGTQETAAAEGTFNIRFVAAVNALEYSAAGFRISTVIQTASGDTQTVAEKTYTVSTVYQALTASENGQIELIEAPCGTYYMALVLNHVPADAEITFTVTSFVIEGENTIDSQSVSVSYADGAIA